MRESQIQRQILLHLGSQPDMRFWRSASGAARNPVIGEVVHSGMPGHPDLTGLRETTCAALGIPVPDGSSASRVRRRGSNRPAGVSASDEE